MREYAVSTDQDLQLPLTPEGMRKIAVRGVERGPQSGVHEPLKLSPAPTR